MRILVTGASGLLGSTTAARLVDAGHTVTTIHRSASCVEGARHVRGSITDPVAVRTAVEGAEAVIHLAAKVSMTGALSEFRDVNVEGMRIVLDCARKAGVTKFVSISSPSVAHLGSSLSGDGAGPASPEHARGNYARTKAEGELLALAADSDDFRVLVLRPHIMWGPGDAQLLERLVDRARKGRLPIIGGGTALVDTLYSDNAVDAVLAALDAVDHTHGEALVVTNGEPRMIGEILQRFALLGAAEPPRLRLPKGLALAAGSGFERAWEFAQQKDEPPLTRFLVEQMTTAHWFDQRHTREVLQWTPAVSIAEGIRRCAEYYGGTTA